MNFTEELRFYYVNYILNYLEVERSEFLKMDISHSNGENKPKLKPEDSIIPGNLLSFILILQVQKSWKRQYFMGC